MPTTAAAPLTAAARARKIARAQRLVAEAAALLGEVYDSGKDTTYRMAHDEREAHYAVGRGANAAEDAVKALEGLR